MFNCQHCKRTGTSLLLRTNDSYHVLFAIKACDLSVSHSTMGTGLHAHVGDWELWGSFPQLPCAHKSHTVLLPKLSPSCGDGAVHLRQQNASEISRVCLYCCIQSKTWFNSVVPGHAEPHYYCSGSGLYQQQHSEA